jgi:hypothetical protein
MGVSRQVGTRLAKFRFNRAAVLSACSCISSASNTELPATFSKDPCSLLLNLANDVSRSLDLVYQAHTLTGEKVHALDLSTGISRRRDSAKSGKRYAYTA